MRSERINNFLLWVIAVGLWANFGLILSRPDVARAQNTANTAKTVRTQNIEVTDKQGRVRVKISGADFRMFDEEGKTRLGMNYSSDGAFPAIRFTMLGNKGLNIIGATVEDKEKGHPSIMISENDNHSIMTGGQISFVTPKGGKKVSPDD